MGMKHDSVSYVIASEDELVEILSGSSSATAGVMPLSPGSRLAERMTGVFLKHFDDERPPKPIMLVSREQDQRRLFARFSQLRSDLSPLSSWCHLVSPEMAERLDDLTVSPSYGGFEAAWCGLIVADAALMTRRAPSKLSSAACFTTQSFAIARSAGLWGALHHNEIFERFDQARNVFGARHDRVLAARQSLSPIWAALLSASAGVVGSGDRVIGALSNALIALSRRGDNEVSSGRLIAGSLLGLLSEAVDLQDVEELPSKARLALYDKIVDRLRGADPKADRAILTAAPFICGYLATIMAGGQASYSVAEASSSEFPEILAWAYVIGGLREKVTWTSGFEGLGRIVARELERPLHFADGPTADVAIEEARSLIDPALSDPLVHIKLKSSRTAQVSLYPGVVTLIGYEPNGESEVSRRSAAQSVSRAADAMAMTSKSDSVLSALADALVPLLQDRLRISELDKRVQTRSKSTNKTRASTESKHKSLPFDDSKR